LIYYVSEQHANAFDNVDYVKTFSQLKLRYDQHRDREKDMMSKMATSATMATANTPPPVWKREQREIDRDEQDWFEDDEVCVF
jgi:protein phosphatase-4 regulatory subunit 3